jgi:hypothetical protein
LHDEELKKGLKERRLTVRECALIQTFPPDYEFVIENKNGRKGSFLVSPSQAYKIIGNAVPPLLAYNLATRIEEVWDLYFRKQYDMAFSTYSLLTADYLNNMNVERKAYFIKTPRKTL